MFVFRVTLCVVVDVLDASTPPTSFACCVLTVKLCFATNTGDIQFRDGEFTIHVENCRHQLESALVSLSSFKITGKPEAKFKKCLHVSEFCCTQLTRNVILSGSTRVRLGLRLCLVTLIKREYLRPVHSDIRRVCVTGLRCCCFCFLL